jgi:hypothetical protein
MANQNAYPLRRGADGSIDFGFHKQRSGRIRKFAIRDAFRRLGGLTRKLAIPGRKAGQPGG